MKVWDCHLPLRTFLGRFFGIGRSTGKRISRNQNYKRIEQFVKVGTRLDGVFDIIGEFFDKHRFVENDLLPMSEGLANFIQNLFAKG